VNTKREETEIKDKPEAGPAENPESGTVVFKVQLMASAKDLPLRPDDFRGLGNLSKEPYKNLYRYLYGNTNSYEEAKLLKTNADLKGYTTSFIVAYRDGIRLPMKEAMKYAGD
jgi:N-acetylmuramoyl-L-alanine amidase